MAYIVYVPLDPQTHEHNDGFKRMKLWYINGYNVYNPKKMEGCKHQEKDRWHLHHVIFEHDHLEI